MKQKKRLYKYFIYVFIVSIFCSNIYGYEYDGMVERAISKKYIPHLKKGYITIRRFSIYDSDCSYYKTPDKGKIQLNGDIDALNLLLENEVTTHELAIIYLKSDIKRLLLTTFESRGDIISNETTPFEVSTAATIRYDRYLNKENQSMDDFFQMIADRGGDKALKLDDPNNKWEMKFYVYNSRYSMELWDASGTIFPLRLLKFSKEKIVLPQEGMFKHPLVFGN